jgi:HEAT repeat protein
MITRRFLVLGVLLSLVPLSRAADNKAEVAELVKQLKAKKPADRVKAAEALGKLGTGAKGASTALVNALMEKYPENREDYLGALEKVNPAVYKPLVTILVDNNNEYSDFLNAIKGIGKLRAEGAACATALLWVYDKETKRKKDALGETRAARTCPEIIQALGAIAPKDKRVIQVVLKAIEVEERYAVDEANLLAALTAAKEMTIEPRLLVPALTTATTNKPTYRSPKSNLVAIEMLGELGKDAKDAVRTLNKLKLDSDAKVREAATEALKKITP